MSVRPCLLLLLVFADEAFGACWTTNQGSKQCGATEKCSVIAEKKDGGMKLTMGCESQLPSMLKDEKEDWRSGLLGIDEDVWCTKPKLNRVICLCSGHECNHPANLDQINFRQVFSSHG